MQQINLYQDDFREKVIPYSASIILILNMYILMICAVVLVILIIIYQVKENQYQLLSDKEQYWLGQLTQVKKSFPEPKIDEQLLSEIARYEIQERQNLIIIKHLNKKDTFDINVKFSEYLTGLAMVDQDDTWLNFVEIDKSGKSIELEGFAIHSDAIPEYLNKLSRIEIFSNMDFERIEISKKGEYLNFIVASEIEEEESGFSLERSSTQNR